MICIRTKINAVYGRAETSVNVSRNIIFIAEEVSDHGTEAVPDDAGGANAKYNGQIHKIFIPNNPVRYA